MKKPGFTVIHTNDFHNKLTREKAGALATMKADAGANTLLIDAGDAISAGNVTYHLSEPVYDLMKIAGYDAMTMGNREFHFSRSGLNAKLAQASFPVLCANLYSATGDPPPVRRWTSFHFADLKVIVFGLTVPMITDRMKVRIASPYRFAAPKICADEVLDTIKRDEHPDVVILLSHCGLRTDKEIAENTPGIDLIVGGHTHSILPTGERVGQCLIVQAGSFARYAGVVEAHATEDGYDFNPRLVEL